MTAQFRPTVYHAMSHGSRHAAGMLFYGRSQRIERVTLRLANAVAPHQSPTIGRPNAQSSVVSPDPLSAPCQHRLFSDCPAPVEPELQRRRAAVQTEDEVIVFSRRPSHRQAGHFQFRISSLSIPSACAYSTLSMICPFSHSFTCAPIELSRGTRSITSIARSKRSIWFRIASSSGVLIFPFSL